MNGSEPVNGRERPNPRTASAIFFIALPATRYRRGVAMLAFTVVMGVLRFGTARSDTAPVEKPPVAARLPH
jgi:hypothetical protein